MQAPAGSDSSEPVPPSEQAKILLSSLESARDLLARRLVNEHHAVTDHDLNYITVSTLLQVLFLKTGQECGLVDPGMLSVLAGCDGIPNRMARACLDAGLSPDVFFEKGPEGTRPLPALPDKPLREILRGMDQPDIPAPVFPLALEEFVAVLEHFLGTRVVAAEGSRVNRVAKSAMLYTGAVDVPPQRIVGFVVSEAIGGITDGSNEGKEPESRVLDPACGSGVFLLAAYRHLVCKKIRSVDRQGQVQDLLQNLGSVFGVDIDTESVSAARIVLLFAFIEESRRSGSGTPSPAQIREVCSGLIKTIRCGNALIAPDYFVRKPVFPFNAAERRKVNPFDWMGGFPEVMGAGGFDAVIGAPPPYRPLAVPAREEYFQTHYETYSPSAGLYGYFTERGLSLLKPRGKLVVLVPGTFLRSRNARPLRRFLLTFLIDAVVQTGRTRLLAKSDAGMYILLLRNKPPGHNSIVVQEWGGPDLIQDLSGTKRMFKLNQDSLDDGGWILEDTRTADILEKILGRGTTLDQYVMGDIETGVHHVRNNPLVVDRETKNRLTTGSWWCRRFFVPLLRPSDVRRYRPAKPERYVLLAQSRRDLKKCRDLVTYLEKIKNTVDQPCGTTGRENPDTAPLLSISRQDSGENRPKIIFSEFQHSPAFFFDQKGAFALTRSLHAIPRNDPFLAGILNSTLARFVITQTCPCTDRGYHVSPVVVRKFPVYIPDFDNPDDKARHDRMVALVNEMLELHKHLSHAKTEQEKRIITQEIESTDRQIDSLVYGIYGLTADEIAVVEEIIGNGIYS